MTNSFVIDQVSWHTGTPGNTETREQIAHRFCVIANFLQDNGLTSRNLRCQRSDIDDRFALSSDDLTADGLAVMKTAYDKWLRKVDSGMPPEDVSVLTRALSRVRPS